MGDTIVTAQYEKEESIVPPTEPEQPQAPGQGGRDEQHRNKNTNRRQFGSSQNRG